MVSTSQCWTVVRIVFFLSEGWLWGKDLVLASIEEPPNRHSDKQDSNTSFKANNNLPTTIPRACMPPKHNTYLFCNTSLPLSERIDDLISRLTLEEKPTLLTARYSPKSSVDRLGIPEYNYGSSCMHGVESRCTKDNRCPTSFPNPNSLGAAFNRTLWNAIGKTMGLELRALWLQNVGENNPEALPHLGLDCWSPNLNVQRDPRWGRNLESPSEDPYLLGSYGVSLVRGLQDNPDVDPRYLQAVATLKHFAAHSLEGRFWDRDGQWKPPKKGHENSFAENNHTTSNTESVESSKISRHNQDAHVSLYDLTTTYLKAFEASVREGGAAGIMCAFNRINGEPVSVSETLLKRVLREEWGFDGYVTSDTGGLNDVKDGHKYTHDWPTTASMAISAGCDVESIPPRGYSGKGGGTVRKGVGGVKGIYIDFLPNAIRNGTLSESSLNEALRNVLRMRFRLGLFDPIEDQPFWNVSPNVVQSPAHVQLSKEATAQGLVLLKNENGLLPLAVDNPTNTTTATLALIGPHVYDRITTIGNYHGEICKDDLKNKCVPSFVEGFSEAMKTHSVGEVQMIVSKGCSVVGNDTSGFDDAIEAASKAEVVIFLGGLDLHLEAESEDRPDIRLPEIQTQLLQKLASVNPKIVLVLLHGGMVGLDNVLNHVEAIVSAGYPGRYASKVLPEALLGVIDRGVWGKSPVTWYKNSFVDEFNMLDMDMGKAPGRTHRYYTRTPNFRFGFGLNPLTTFGLTNLKVIALSKKSSTHKTLEKCLSSIELSVKVSNVGHRAADEVVMGYFSPKDIPQSEPASKLRQQLFGFDRIHLQADQSKNVSFVVQVQKTLRLATGSGKPRTFPGRYIIRIGNGMDFLETDVTVTDDGCFQIENQTDSNEVIS